jgi:hypothetical protein
MELIFVKTSRLRLFVCGLLLWVMVIGFAATAAAAPSLTWQTDRVYYDSSGRIVIEGYFYNNGSQTVNWVNWFDVQVYFRQANTNWWQQASATFRDVNVYLEPGDSVRWTFRIHGVDYAYFDYWNVKWNVNYNYR